MATILASTLRPVKRNSIDNSIYIPLTTAKVAANLTIYYCKPHAAAVQITPSDLAAITTAHTDGGVKEVANMAGVYRLDIPDAMVASSVKGSVAYLHVIVAAGDTYIYVLPIVEDENFNRVSDTVRVNP